MSSIKHRLTYNSTVLFTQNGIGTIEEVASALFPNSSTRPHYLASATSHGVYSLGPFRSVHTGLANITTGPALLLGQRYYQRYNICATNYGEDTDPSTQVWLRNNID
jgi:2-dehydropantoate 2-reductase